MIGRITVTAPGSRARLLLGERGTATRSAIHLLVAFALLGLAANEIGQCIMTKVRVENAAASAAQAAADDYVGHRNYDEARAAAVAAAEQADPHARVTTVQLLTNGAFTVTAREPANTVLLQRVSFLRRFGVQTAEQQETHGS